MWKKAIGKAPKLENDENAVLEELAKDGTGARKRSRKIGAKENIANPRWKEKGPEAATPLKRGDQGILTPNRQKMNLNIPQSASSNIASPFVNKEPTLKFIPRKRTNTDHVITPRKGLRQTTLNQQAQRLPLTELSVSSPGKPPRRTKSMRKSGRQSMLSQLDEEPAVIAKPISAPILARFGETESTDSATPPKIVAALEELEEEQSTRSALSTNPRMARLGDAQGPSTPISRVSRAKIAEPKTAPPKVLTSLDALSPEEPKEGLIQRSARPLRFGSSSSRRTPLPARRAIRRISSLDKLLGTPEPDPPTMKDETSASERGHEIPLNEHAITVKKHVADVPFSSFAKSAESDTEEADEKAPADIDENQITESKEPEVSSTADMDEDAENSAEDISEVDPHEIIATAVDVSFATDTASPSAQLAEMQARAMGTLEDTIESVTQFSPSKSLAEVSAARQEEEITTGVDEAAVETDNDGQPNAGSQRNSGSIGGSKAQDEVIPSIEEAAFDPPIVNFYQEDDDTAMLQNFLTRAKASKAAKQSPKRKRSLPHSPLRLPLGETENILSPSPVPQESEFDLPESSPSKRTKRSHVPLSQDSKVEEPQSIRRSMRTRLPVQAKAPPGAPSFIPVRRLGQDVETTVTLKRSEDKELAALTRVNTRKNRGGAQMPPIVLAKQAEEKDDVILRQMLLKEVLDEKIGTDKDKTKVKGKSKSKSKGKGVTVKWAEELVQVQTFSKGKAAATSKKEGGEKDKRSPEKATAKATAMALPVPDKKTSVKVGVRSKMALGMVMNGTPAPKRRVRARSGGV